MIAQTQALHLSRFRTAGVLSFRQTLLPFPDPGRTPVRHLVTGVADLHRCKGVVAAFLSLPNGLEAEEAEDMTANGEAGTESGRGDRVASMALTPGASALTRSLPATRALKLPCTFDDTAPAMVFKAPAAEGTGGRAIVLRSDDLPARVKQIAGGTRGRAAFDPVMADTFPASLDRLAPPGIRVSFVESSGPVPPLAFGFRKSKGSPCVTRPLRAGHTADPAECRTAAHGLSKPMPVGTLAAPQVTSHLLPRPRGRRTTWKPLHPSVGGPVAVTSRHPAAMQIPDPVQSGAKALSKSKRSR